MFITAPAVTAKSWKQPIYPPTEDWIKKMWYQRIIKCYLAINNDRFEKFVGKWMHLENRTVNKEVRHTRLNTG